MMISDSYDDVFSSKQRILVVTAHPDDNEVICGGLVARLTRDGKKVRLVVTTNGDKGTQDKAIPAGEFGDTRKAEQQAAAEILGIPKPECFNLNVPDGYFEASVDNISLIVQHIRKFRPDIVITHNPEEAINTFSSKEGIHWVNHRDHRNTALAVTDAVYPYSRDRGFFPEQLKDGLEPHTVTELLFSDSYEHPQRLYFDVTDFIGLKRKALAQCESVIEADHVEEYISELKTGERYYEQLRYLKDLY